MHDGIIFENIGFSKVTVFKVSTLLSERDRIITTNKGEVLISRHAKLIFTTRDENGRVFGDLPALRRLYKSCYKLRVARNILLDDSSSESDEILDA